MKVPEKSRFKKVVPPPTPRADAETEPSPVDLFSETGLRMQREYFLSAITDADFINRYQGGPYAECARRIVAIK
jgi:hypothetical protein